MCPRKVPTKQSKDANFKARRHLTGYYLSRKMLRVAENGQIAKSPKSLRKRKINRHEPLLCIYYRPLSCWEIYIDMSSKPLNGSVK